MFVTGLPVFEPLLALNAAFPSIKQEFRSILEDVCDRNDMPEAIASRIYDYYSRCLECNVMGGKLARAQTVCKTLVFCSADEPENVDAKMKAALVLGWAVELLQAVFLIEDDVMDGGETRRGKPCWYRYPDVGMSNAINDGLLLEQVLYEMIEVNEQTKPMYIKAHRALRDASIRTVLGQHLDTHPPTSVLEFTRDQWLSVVRFKTAFYTFVLPCELGILVSGKQFSAADLATLRQVCLLMGELFQAQDDMLDCYGDPAFTGKVGRDIEEGKCTWLWYTAMELLPAGHVLRDELISLYSSAEKSTDPSLALRVKAIYREIGLEAKFAEFLNHILEKLSSSIAGFEAEELRNLTTWLVDTTKGRQK